MNDYVDELIQVTKFILLDADIPEWANWVAVDRSGAICYFECEPVADNYMKGGIWHSEEMGSKWLDAGTRNKKFRVFDERLSIHWKEVKFKV